MDDDSHVIDKGWDALPDYAKQAGDGDDAVTVSISTTPGEWLVNTVDSVVVPMSMADVVDALRARKLTELSLVWRNGMPEWAPIDKVPQLKLAARLPPTQPHAPPARPSSPAPAARPTPSKPSNPPTRSTPAPQLGAPIGPSRRATLPFGLPTPNPSSRPAQPRPSSAPMSAAPPSDEPVLAVYARPAATISFDLSPSEPARVPPPVPTPPPQTLAPTTSDTRSAPRAPAPRPPAYNADLSVVAASQFRAVQRTSKRKLLVSSLVSAAAASALTLWLSGALPWSRSSAKPAPPAPQAAAAPVAPAPSPAAPAPAASPPTEASAAAAAPSAAPVSAPLAQVAVPPPARPAAVARKPRPASAAPRVKDADRTAQTDKAEGNPSDVKLDEAASDTAGKPPARGLLEMIQANERGDVEAKPPEAKPPEASAATGSSAPGF